MTDLLEDTKNNIGKIGAIIAAIVAMNTGITSCTNADIERMSRFRAAVAQEEAFTKGLLDQYVALASEENAKVKDRRAFALLEQLKRPPPDFREYRSALGFDRQTIRATHRRFLDANATLHHALSQELVVGERVAQAVQQQSASQASDALPTSGGRTALPNSVVVSSAPQTPDPRTLQIYQGSRTGWDFDIFWCVVGDDATTNASNFSKARAVATQLASPSLTNVEVGRVRLRPLPELRQGAGLPARGSGLSIRSDADPAERETSNKIRTWIGGQSPSFDFAQGYSAQNTRFYISLFVCEAP